MQRIRQLWTEGYGCSRGLRGGLHEDHAASVTAVAALWLAPVRLDSSAPAATALLRWPATATGLQFDELGSRQQAQLREKRGRVPVENFIESPQPSQRASIFARASSQIPRAQIDEVRGERQREYYCLMLVFRLKGFCVFSNFCKIYCPIGA